MMMKRVQGTDKEINRFVRLTELEAGNPLSFTLKQM